MSQALDVGGVCQELQDGTLPNRRELIDKIRQAMLDDARVARLLEEITYECVHKKKQPIEFLGIALQYGIALGITLARREKKAVN